MSGDWIKMRSNLWDDPRITGICDRTGQSEASIVGACYWLWATADQHSANGTLPGISLAAIDRKTGVKGFAQAMVDSGWLAECDGGVQLLRFEDHNGASAKKRAQTGKRVANHRCNDTVMPHPETRNADSVTKSSESVTGALAREEKRREEESSSSEQSPDQPKKRKWGSDDDHKTAQWIFSLVRRLNPDQKEPNWDGWADDVRLMRERDGRSHKQICELFKLANADSFWKSNVLSPGKLREKWDALSIKLNVAISEEPIDGYYEQFRGIKC